MVDLYALSNIFVPLVLISYLTVLKISKKQKVGYGQWLLMILVFGIGNFLSIFVKFKGWVLIIDLSLKIIIALLPQNINIFIERKVMQMQLSTSLEFIRRRLIGYFFIWNCKLTEYLFSKMNDSQIRHFKSILIERLSKQDTNIGRIEDKIGFYSKKFQSVGVHCDIPIPQSQVTRDLHNYIQKKQKQKSLKKDMAPTQDQGAKRFKEIKVVHNSNSMPKFINNVELKYSKQQKQKERYQETKRQSYQNFTLRRSATNILDELDNIEDPRKSKFARNIELMGKAPSPQQNYNFKKSQKKVQEIEDTAERLLNQLNMSVSDYSEMFEDQINEDEKNLICKVQSIVEIGSGTNLRLEIYNLELYSNSQLKIVSLYGRQFEKHKLISVTPLAHNYYELKLSGNVVNQRKVKFRSNFQPFTKYIQRT